MQGNGKTAIILLHSTDSIPSAYHSLLKISNSMVLLQVAYDSTSQHQHAAHLPQGNASSIFTQLLQTCLGPRLYFYIAVVNSCSWLCLKILRNKLIHFCMLSQPACLMPVGIRSTLILGSFRLRVSAPTQHKPLGQEMLPPALGSVLWCTMS